MSRQSYRTVLVVDDERAVRHVASEMLRRDGFEVLTAADGDEALETYRRERARLDGIVLDLTLPTVRGEDVLRTIRAGGDLLPVIVTSGYGAEQVSEVLQGMDSVAVLAKPYTPTELLETVRQAFGNAKAS